MAKAKSKAVRKKTTKKATRKVPSKKKSSTKKASKKKALGWGGWRPGAGRKPDPDSGVSHRPRPVVRPKDFVLVTMRLAPGYVRMSLKAVDKIVGEAVELGEKPGFKIESHEVAKGLILLNIRAKDRNALSRGIQGFGIRVTRALNRKRGEPGRAFADRYDATTFGSSAERRKMAQKVKSGGRIPHRSVNS